MELLSGAIKRHLDAAEGWLGLGNRLEAVAELESIPPELMEHPEVLEVRWQFCAAAKEWEAAVKLARKLSELMPESPFGFVHHAYALHELKRTTEAQAVLMPISSRFPQDFIIPYNLACYACQLRDLEEAWTWLAKARRIAGATVIQKMALADEDLKPLWVRIKEQSPS